MKLNMEKLPESLRKKGLDAKLEKICRKNDIVFLAIFGSFVRGEQNKASDIDIAIEFDEKKKKSLLDLLRTENELSEIFGRKVDLGIFSSLNPIIVDDVRKEMLVIYQRIL